MDDPLRQLLWSIYTQRERRRGQATLKEEGPPAIIPLLLYSGGVLMKIVAPPSPIA